MALLGQSSFASDQEKFLASALVENIMLRLVCKSVCDPVEMPEGAGITANFVRYRRMNVPLTTLAEGVDPASSTFSLDALTVTLDQWGDILEVTDVGEMSAKHPVMQQMVDLLADNAQRVIDREVQLVWMAGTNVLYGDGVVTSRVAVGPTMKANTAALLKARVTLVDAGAPPRFGPGHQGPVNNAKVDGTSKESMFTGGQHYLAICGPQVIADITAETTAVGGWMSVQIYQNKNAIYNYELGTWLGFRWVESNFIPKFRLLGGSTPAVVSGNAFGSDTPTVTTSAAGSLTNVSHFFKVTRKDLLRGFEEYISMEHTITPPASGRINFNFTAGVTAGFVYNVYVGTAAGDANIKQFATTNIAVGTSVNVDTLPTGIAAPGSIMSTSGPAGVHPIFIHAAHSCNWVGLQNFSAYLTDNTRSYYGNILRLKRAAGYKFMGKTMIRNQTHVLRFEVASNY